MVRLSQSKKFENSKHILTDYQTIKLKFFKKVVFLKNNLSNILKKNNLIRFFKSIVRSRIFV